MMGTNVLPQIRFADFTKELDYSQFRFDEIFDFSTGKNIKQSEAAPEFKTPCVRYGELYHLYGEVITKVVNKTNLAHSELTFSQGNEVLLPSAGEDPLDIGSASALTLDNVAIGRTINVLRPKGTVPYSHVYVSFYINEKLKKKISTLARGASISNVYNSDLKGLKITLPSIDEQNKIADFLSAVDKKISLLKEKHALLEQYKKGVMQKLFKREIRFKDDDGSEFPDWQETKLGTWLEEYKEKSQIENQYEVLTSSRKGLIKQSDYYGEGRITERKNLGFNVIPSGFLTYRSRSDDRQFFFNKNDLGFTGIISTYYPVFTMKNKQNDFFVELTRMHKNKFGRQAVGTSQVVLSFNELKNIKLPMPSSKEQEKITNFSLELDTKLRLLKEQIELIQTFKKGLMQKMFV